MAGDSAASRKFDPYHKWLGIPPTLQPANYYRLLGLESFESDVDSIEAAADRLIRFVRDAATGERREAGRKILAELQSAKVCLLSPEQKQAYDAGLRANPVGMHDPPPRAEQKKARAQPIVQASKKLTRATTKRVERTKRSVPLLQLIAAGIGGLVLIVAAGWLWLRDPSLEELKPVEIAGLTTQTNEVTAALPTPSADLATNEPEIDAAVAMDEVAVIDVVVGEAAPVESDLPDFAPPSDIDTAPTVPETRDETEEPAMVGPINDETGEVADIAGDTPVAADDSITTTTLTEASYERGSVLRDVWSNVTGNKVEEFVQHIQLHPAPDETEPIDRLETPEDFADQYGQRLRGFLYPPATGTYEFSIRANAEGWLFVGTDTTRESLRRIEPKTKVELTGGNVYAFEAFHKESTGRDYFRIGWTLPDGTEENPIGGERLSQHYRIVPQHESKFIVLAPATAESQSGTKLTICDDGRIVANRSSVESDVYRMTFDSAIEHVTALRLEAMPDDSLPASGPGQGIGGRFSIREVSVSLLNKVTNATLSSLNFVSVVDQKGRDVSRICDGSPATMWRSNGRGKASSATFLIRDPASQVGGTALGVEVHQSDLLGSFRVLATSAPNPLATPPPNMNSDEGLFELYVNVGGDDFVTPDGVRWRTSKFFDNKTFGHEGGNRVSEDQLINKVSGTAQRGISAFRAVVPDGSYDVTLYFCEYWSTSASSRRFAIAAEAQIVAARFDLLQAAGGFAEPFVLPIRNLSVTDGRLDVQFKRASESSSTILNAISIRQLPERKRR